MLNRRRAGQGGTASVRRTRQSGSSLLETVLVTPILILLLVGMVELARVTYTHYTLHKILYTAARYLGTQQDVNFCDDGYSSVTAAKNYATTRATASSTTTMPA